jgi:hypothetical protein
MDEFEKVEKLRQRADVSYEDAKKALEAANGDLLDAMIYLEKEGKTANTMSNGEIVVSSVVVDGEEKKSHKKNSSENGEKFKEFCKTSWKKGNENFFVVTHKSNVIIKIPVWAMIVLLIFTFHVTLPVMLISLFFGVRYSFMGEADFDTLNKAMDKAGEYVDNVKEEFSGNKEN